MGLGRKEKRRSLEKIMLDYVRWIFNLDFCTPRYLMSRELGLEKLRIRRGIRGNSKKKLKIWRITDG